jgi:hypothetical protein
MRPPTPAEARRFLAGARGHPLEALFVLAVTTGNRQGELLALRWRDLDWPTAERSTTPWSEWDGRRWLGEPKTAKSGVSDADHGDPTWSPTGRASGAAQGLADVQFGYYHKMLWLWRHETTRCCG